MAKNVKGQRRAKKTAARKILKKATAKAKQQLTGLDGQFALAKEKSTAANALYDVDQLKAMVRTIVNNTLTMLQHINRYITAIEDDEYDRTKLTMSKDDLLSRLMTNRDRIQQFYTGDLRELVGTVVKVSKEQDDAVRQLDSVDTMLLMTKTADTLEKLNLSIEKDLSNANMLHSTDWVLPETPSQDEEESAETM